jgi:hypothetical protein
MPDLPAQPTGQTVSDQPPTPQVVQFIPGNYEQMSLLFLSQINEKLDIISKQLTEMNYYLTFLEPKQSKLSRLKDKVKRK